MEINWIIISIVAICVIVLLIYVIKRNAKDEKNLTKLLNENEHSITEKDEDLLTDAE